MEIAVIGMPCWLLRKADRRRLRRLHFATSHHHSSAGDGTESSKYFSFLVGRAVGEPWTFTQGWVVVVADQIQPKKYSVQRSQTGTCNIMCRLQCVRPNFRT